DAARSGNVLERAVATVPVEAVGQAFEIARVAVDADATRLVAAIAPSLGRPADVIDHQQVEPAVVVVVEPPAGGGPLTAADGSAIGDVFERSVATIAKELVAGHAGDEEIDVAVVVVI